VSGRLGTDAVIRWSSERRPHSTPLPHRASTNSLGPQPSGQVFHSDDRPQQWRSSSGYAPLVLFPVPGQRVLYRGIGQRLLGGCSSQRKFFTLQWFVPVVSDCSMDLTGAVDGENDRRILKPFASCATASKNVARTVTSAFPRLTYRRGIRAERFFPHSMPPIPGKTERAPRTAFLLRPTDHSNSYAAASRQFRFNESGDRFPPANTPLRSVRLT